MKRLLTIAFLLCSLSAMGTDNLTRYVNSGCSNNGDGTAASCASTAGGAGAWKAFANVSSTWCGADSILYVLAGPQYRESYTVPCSGTAGHPATIKGYGTGTLPVLSGANDYSCGSSFTWAASPTGTHEYYLTAAGGGTPGIAQPTYVWINGVYASTQTPGALDNGRSGWGNDPSATYPTLYIRWDAGPPCSQSLSIEGSQRTNGISTSPRNYVTIDRLQVQRYSGSPVLVSSTANVGIRITNSVLKQSATESATTAGLDIVSTVIDEMYNATAALTLTGIAGGIINVQSSTVAYSVGGSGVSISGGGAVNLDHILSVGHKMSSVYNSGTAALSVTNSYIGAGETGAALRSVSGATCTYSNSVVLSRYTAPTAANVQNYCTDGGGNTVAAPRWVAHRFPSMFAVTWDDYYNADLLTLTSAANARGIPMTANLAFTRAGTYTPTQWANITAKAALGNTPALHTRSHLAMNSLSAGAFSIRYTGAAAAATLSLDVASHRLTTTLDGATDIDVDLSQWDALANPTQSLVNAINAHGGYTAAILGTAGRNEKNYHDYADVSAQDIKTATYNVPMDAARTWAYEYGGNKADIAAGVGLTPMALAWPACSTDQTSQLAAKDYVYGARSCDSGEWSLSSLNIYNTQSLEWSDTTLDLSSAEGIRRSAFTLLEHGYERGGVSSSFSHGLGFLTAEQWAQGFDGLALYGGNFVTLDTLYRHLSGRSSGIFPSGTDADGNGLRYTRIMAGTPDYHPRMGSGLCGKGSTPASVTGSVTKDIGPYPCIPRTVFGGVM